MVEYVSIPTSMGFHGGDCAPEANEKIVFMQVAVVLEKCTKHCSMKYRYRSLTDSPLIGYQAVWRIFSPKTAMMAVVIQGAVPYRGPTRLETCPKEVTLILLCLSSCS